MHASLHASLHVVPVWKQYYWYTDSYWTLTSRLMLSSLRPTRRDKTVLSCAVVSDWAMWTGPLQRTCSDVKISVGDSLESSRIQFTPQTRRDADTTVLSCRVGSGRAVWIGCNITQTIGDENLRIALQYAISENTCCWGCHVPRRSVIGWRGERGRIATPIS